MERHTLKESFERVRSGGRVLSSKEFFIEGTKEYPGIIYTSVNRFAWWMPWEHKRRSALLKKRAYEYNRLYDSLLHHEKYIRVDSSENGPMPVLTWAGRDVLGWAGLLEMLQKKYPLSWSVAWKLFVLIVTALNLPSIWKALFR